MAMNKASAIAQIADMINYYESPARFEQLEGDILQARPVAALNLTRQDLAQLWHLRGTCRDKPSLKAAIAEQIGYVPAKRGGFRVPSTPAAGRTPTASPADRARAYLLAPDAGEEEAAEEEQVETPATQERSSIIFCTVPSAEELERKYGRPQGPSQSSGEQPSSTPEGYQLTPPPEDAQQGCDLDCETREDAVEKLADIVCKFETLQDWERAAGENILNAKPVELLRLSRLDLENIWRDRKIGRNGVEIVDRGNISAAILATHLSNPIEEEAPAAGEAPAAAAAQEKVEPSCEGEANMEQIASDNALWNQILFMGWRMARGCKSYAEYLPLRDSDDAPEIPYEAWELARDYQTRHNGPGERATFQQFVPLCLEAWIEQLQKEIVYRRGMIKFWTEKLQEAKAQLPAE